MDFTPRIKQILQVMLLTKQTMSIQSLADKVGVSKRTIQRELEYINGSLKSYEIRFMSKTGVGVWLEGAEEEKERLFHDLMRGDSYDVSNREDRRKRLILEILKDKGLKKLFYYSSKFKVSEATISADLEAVWKLKGTKEITAERSAHLSMRILIQRFFKRLMKTRENSEQAARDFPGVISGRF